MSGALLTACPQSTAAERARFLRARKGNVKAATDLLDAHRRWRKERLPPKLSDKLLGRGVSRWVFVPPSVRAVDDTLVVVALPALIQPKRASAEEHAFAVAVLLEDHLSHDSEERITIIADVGGVSGGGNATPLALMPIIRALSSVLSTAFPERLQCLIVFPVPLAARGIWAAIKAFLDPVTASKVALLPGGGKGRRFEPTQLGKYIDLSSLPAGPLYGFDGADDGDGDGRIPPHVDLCDLASCAPAEVEHEVEPTTSKR